MPLLVGFCFPATCASASIVTVFDSTPAIRGFYGHGRQWGKARLLMISGAQINRFVAGSGPDCLGDHEPSDAFADDIRTRIIKTGSGACYPSIFAPMMAMAFW